MSNTVKTPIADVLGNLLADKADIASEIEGAKIVLIGIAAQDGTKAFEGDLFRATVSFGTKRVTDYKAVLAELVARGCVKQDVVDSVLIDHTQMAEGVPSVRCVARKG